MKHRRIRFENLDRRRCLPTSDQGNSFSCFRAAWAARGSRGKQESDQASTQLVESVVVADGFDVADDYIAEHAAAEDLVITADIPLAARIVAGGGTALDPRGELYTEENVGERLSMRDLMMELRSDGSVQGGPSQFGLADRQRFASSLDRILTRFMRNDAARIRKS